MTTRDILKRFQQISDADLSLADIQWLTRTIKEKQNGNYYKNKNNRMGQWTIFR